MEIKILVISESCGNVGPILTAIDREKPDVLIHLGGGIRDLADLTFSGKVYAVRSGSEFGKKLPTASKLSYDREMILFTHADGMSMPKDQAALAELATTQGATIVLFGSDAEPTYFEQNGVKFVCPGHIYDRKKGTYAILRLSPDADAIVEHKKLMEC